MTRRKPPPPDWTATTNAHRKRKMITLTLSDEARARLGELAETFGAPMSAVVDALLCSMPPLQPRGEIAAFLARRPPGPRT